MRLTTERLEVDTRRRHRNEHVRILLTNDDGVRAPGLAALAAALHADYDLLVVAPEEDRSGSGTGIGSFDPTKGVDVTPVQVGGVDAFALAGPPGLAVMSAMLGAFGEPPDVVVSGTNAGVNAGHSVVHSGTVGAILTARTFGADGLAVSVEASEPWRFDTAAQVAALCLAWMVKLNEALTLNLNVPPLGIEELRGVRWADLDEFGYFRVAIADVPGRTVQFEVGAPDSGLDPGSDVALLREGFATVTPLTTIEPAGYPTTALPQIVL